MSETKNPAIKLFGKTIPVPEILVGGSEESTIVLDSLSGDVVDGSVDQNHASSSNSSRESHTNKVAHEQEIDKDTLGEKPTDKKKYGSLIQSSEAFTNPDASPSTGEKFVTQFFEREASILKPSKIEEEQGVTSNPQDKNLKKPDKIMPCPRCDSMDTKFCYYNNYNVNQPRHFCKNCQRYWTAGGTMRNIPVGAGRKKNKSCSSHYRHTTVSEAALQNSRTEFSNGAHLTFRYGPPLCESMASVLKLADKTMQSYTRNGIHKPGELRIHVPYDNGENTDDKSNKSSVTSIKSTEGASTNASHQEKPMQNCQSFPPQVPYFPRSPWPFPWNPMQWSSSVPPPPPSTFCPPGFSLPIYPPTTYWGCSVPGAWNMPWLAQPSSPNSASPNSGPNSPTLGKHSREDNTLILSELGGMDGHDSKESKNEKSLWVPKISRIDDSGEVAKRSIWTKLGTKNVSDDSISEGGHFKAFPSKCDEKQNHSMHDSPVLQANPAALSLSLKFPEIL